MTLKGLFCAATCSSVLGPGQAVMGHLFRLRIPNTERNKTKKKKKLDNNLGISKVLYEACCAAE